MINIIKIGSLSNQLRKFDCYHCHTVFIADEDEKKAGDIVQCPLCKYYLNWNWNDGIQKD